MENYNPIVCNYVEPQSTGKDKVAICLFMQQTGEGTYRYRWEVRPWDSTVRDSNRPRFVTKYYDIRDKIELAKLELEKESIKSFLLDSGWTRIGASLRFTRDLYTREDG